ncbi:hypothetical protein Hamer_G003684 [Homarus americanus]|uniref:Uncharacterized protein n=1 Tax=Homarus americanus TaxID=6706 RepID=A0A8J5JUU9_HOMAM|nr:hypothetical protein Hamer_G003684 [Homarus americanus]
MIEILSIFRVRCAVYFKKICTVYTVFALPVFRPVLTNFGMMAKLQKFQVVMK